MFESLESRTLFSNSGTPSHAVHGWRRDPAVLAAAESRAVGSNVLRVSDDGHSLVKADGTPFFYMADTAWHLFNKTTIRQANRYLETRAAQGFTVIQAEINARFGDVSGNRAFLSDDPARP